MLPLSKQSRKEYSYGRGMESVPGAVATGSYPCDLDRSADRDPVATAPGTDLLT
jgi:hypothetical protein